MGPKAPYVATKLGRMLAFWPTTYCTYLLTKLPSVASSLAPVRTNQVFHHVAGSTHSYRPVHCKIYTIQYFLHKTLDVSATSPHHIRQVGSRCLPLETALLQKCCARHSLSTTRDRVNQISWLRWTNKKSYCIPRSHSPVHWTLWLFWRGAVRIL